MWGKCVLTPSEPEEVTKSWKKSTRPPIPTNSMGILFPEPYFSPNLGEIQFMVIRHS